MELKRKNNETILKCWVCGTQFTQGKRKLSYWYESTLGSVVVITGKQKKCPTCNFGLCLLEKQRVEHGIRQQTEK